MPDYARRMSKALYDREFFDIVTGTGAESARSVVPAVVEWLRPATVIDVGCGEGAWAAEFAAAGCAVTGVDGGHVERSRLRIPADRFHAHDLERPLAGLFPGTRFDLAVCLEVAEHLAPARGPRLVDDLAALSDRILFSAAVVGQGGFGHVNERPHEYWVELFEDRRYAATAVLRRRFAGDPAVASWYRSNMLLFVRVTPA